MVRHIWAGSREDLFRRSWVFFLWLDIVTQFPFGGQPPALQRGWRGCSSSTVRVLLMNLHMSGKNTDTQCDLAKNWVGWCLLNFLYFMFRLWKIFSRSMIIYIVTSLFLKPITSSKPLQSLATAIQKCHLTPWCLLGDIHELHWHQWDKNRVSDDLFFLFRQNGLF